MKKKRRGGSLVAVFGTRMDHWGGGEFRCLGPRRTKVNKTWGYRTGERVKIVDKKKKGGGKIGVVISEWKGAEGEDMWVRGASAGGTEMTKKRE